MARAASALATALVLAACATDPLPEPIPEPAPQASTKLRDLLKGATELVVAGRRLNTGSLDRFYARHDYLPVWTTRQAQAGVLLEAVLRAREHGLDPERFHASLLQPDTALPPMDHELALSNAFLSYVDALARGAVPVERRRPDEVLTPEPVDVAAQLDEAIASPDPAAYIEALAPSTPTYKALRQALLQFSAAAPLADTAPIDRPRIIEITLRRQRRQLVPLRYRAAAAPANTASVNRRAIEVNLERQRWLPRQLPPNRVWVNVADERLNMYREGRSVFSTRVIVGEDVEHNQSPEFRATIDASFYNPPWVIPADIAKAEILPKLDTDPDYLTRNKMVMLANGEVEQAPGPDAGLGLVMFDMPNKFDVYLHDTPERTLFARDNRRISHGCIRVQQPRELAALLMDQPLETVDQGIAGGNTTRNNLPTPIPVYVVYQTVFMDEAGALQYRKDFYNRDAAIWQKMQAAA